MYKCLTKYLFFNCFDEIKHGFVGKVILFCIVEKMLKSLLSFLVYHFSLSGDQKYCKELLLFLLMQRHGQQCTAYKSHLYVNINFISRTCFKDVCHRLDDTTISEWVLRQSTVFQFKSFLLRLFLND